MTSHQELRLMLQAARLYYQDSLRQQDVAKELGVSRPTVSRLLAQARQEGIVQIAVLDPFATFEDLEGRLAEAFHLRQAVVVAGEGTSGDLLRRRLGLAAARYLHSALNNDDLVGIGWGRTLHAVVEELDAERKVEIRVSPLLGGLGQLSPSFQVNDLARRLAEAFGGDWQPLYAPAFISDPSTYQALSNVADIERVIQSWFSLDIVLVGIGHFALQRQSSMLFADYMDDDLLQELERRGAAGDLCGRFFDVQGQQCFYERGVIGIALEQLKTLDHVVGVAGGAEKAAAILGALRGGYLNVLVTDTVTAKSMLEAQETGG
jgi:DNA-binding transcriptional regulator LsrR (DeoR family)